MDHPDHLPPVDLDGDGDLSLREASRLYAVSPRTLARRVRRAELRAHQAAGPWGREWRLSREVLDAAGYRRRTEPAGTRTGTRTWTGADDDPRVAALERELASVRRLLAAERRRADRADGELGYLMLECGRLRAAVTRTAAEVPVP